MCVKVTNIIYIYIYIKCIRNVYTALSLSLSTYPRPPLPPAKKVAELKEGLKKANRPGVGAGFCDLNILARHTSKIEVENVLGGAGPGDLKGRMEQLQMWSWY